MQSLFAIKQGMVHIWDFFIKDNHAQQGQS
jgi:hypothetical protein